MKQLLFQGDYRDLKDTQLVGQFNTFRLGTKYAKGKKALKIGEIVWLIHVDKDGKERKICRAVVTFTFNNKLDNLLAHFSETNHAIKRNQLNSAKALRTILEGIYRRKAKNGEHQFTAVGLVRLI